MPDAMRFNWRIWRSWTFANAWSELVGLAGSAGLAILVFGTAAPSDTAAILFVACIMIIMATLLEGGVVGFAQWRVLSGTLSQLTARQWIGATVLGAFVAWGLGMLPSTIMSLQETTTEADLPELGIGLMMGLAAVMGLVLGPVLALFQWLVLRRHLRGAAWWIPAHAVAWAFGMMIIFAGAGALSTEASLLVTGGVLAGTCLLAGTVVGALHALVLIWLLRENRASVSVVNDA